MSLEGRVPATAPAPRQPFDPKAFHDYLLSRRELAAITAEAYLNHVRFLRNNCHDFRVGLELGRVLQASHAALVWRRTERVTDDAYNGTVRALNWLAAYYGCGRPFVGRRGKRRHYEYLLEDQVRAVLQYRGEDLETTLRRRAMVLLALKTGLRSSELARMHLEDLDQAHSRFFVRFPAKRGPQRWLPIESWVWSPRRPLSSYLRWRVRYAPQELRSKGPLWLARPEGFGHGRRYARARGPAGAITEAALRKDLREVGRSIGIRLNCTTTRHTRGTELSDAGWGVQFIQTYLGHATPTTTMIYVAVRPARLDELMRARPGRDFFQGEEGNRERV